MKLSNLYSIFWTKGKCPLQFYLPKSTCLRSSGTWKLNSTRRVMDEPVRGLSANWKLLFGSMNSGR